MRMRNRKILIFAATVFGLFLSASAAFALNTDHPALQVSIPGMKLTDIQTSAGSKIDIPWIGQYISAVYKYATGVGVVIAALMMIIGGFQYTVAGGDSAKVSAAKERVTNGTVGLVILLGAFVLLSSVDPSLTVFKPVPIKIPEQKKFSSVDFATPTKETKKEGEKCEDVAECQEGLKCEEVQSAAAKAKELAVAGLEKAHQAELAIADAADAIAEGVYNSAMKVITDRVKALAALDVDIAKAAAETLGKPVKAARDAAADVRNKARAFADDKFKKAIDALSAQPTPTETPKKQCTK